MRFPEYQRVIFQNNPLAEVTCQLRHPRLLAVDSVLPVDFQSRVCDEYPALEQAKINLKLAGADGAVGNPADSQVLARSYNFKDSSGNWTVGLTSAFLALSTSQYTRWEDFRDRLARVEKAHQECYRVPFYERIGLRYRDIIDRRALGLQGVGWQELVRSELLGLIASDGIEEGQISNSHVMNEVELEQGKLTIQSYFVSNAEGNNEIGLMIDCDFWVEQKIERGGDAIFKTLDEFNRYAGQVFSWAIRDRLREALKPTAV